MTPENFRKLSSAEVLRTTVRILDNCREDFLDRYTALQLVDLAKACMLSEWDFLPDTYTSDQIADVLIRGLVPNWVDAEWPDCILDSDNYANWRRFEGYLPDEPTMRLDGTKVERG